MPRKPETPDVGSLFDLVSKSLHQSITRPNILAFVPYPKQRAVLASPKPGRYVSGGNRAGKTTLEVIDAIWNAQGVHPFRPRPEHWGTGAIKIRFVVVDIVKGVYGIILPELKRWSPTSWLKGQEWGKAWDDKTMTLTFENGSTIQFLTHQMELDKHGGVALHVVYFDEEPPQEIFNENLMRLIDYEGWWLVAATSVNGIGWTYDLLIEPVIENPDNPDIDFFTLGQDDNPYLATEEEERSRYYVGQSKEEQEIRRDGALVARSGLLFPKFGQEIDKFVLAEPLPLSMIRKWTWYTSVDHGFNNPTAWLWHAVSPDGAIYTFAEHYQRFWTVPEHAAKVHEIEHELGQEPTIRVGDPAMRQRQGVTGTSPITEYGLRGVYINVEQVSNDVETGVMKMQEYLRILPSSPWGENMPTWRVSPNCPNLIREMRKVRWAAPDSQKTAYKQNVQEGVHKKDDHAFDSLRYLVSVMPNLNLQAFDQTIFPTDKPQTLSWEEMLVRIAEDPSITTPTDTWVTEKYGDAIPEDEMELFW